MREKKPINIEIGANIQAARERAGFTQEKLSELLGVTPNHLSAIERGVSGISLESLQKLCHILGMSADAILFGSADTLGASPALVRRFMQIPPQYQDKIGAILTDLIDLLS